MGKHLNKALILGVLGLSVNACATVDLPDEFLYETSLRGQQSWYGAGERRAAGAELLAAGVVTSPQQALETALPNAEIELRQWGITYFQKDWARYRTVLEADVTQDGTTTKCRLSTPETAEDAPRLEDLRAEGGVAVQAALERLVARCADSVLNPTSP